ncbi:MAG: FAD-dependent oxidoreductase, partial [archaeon]|nr:FAD-dependent oxidoreductase [archaeon]
KTLGVELNEYDFIKTSPFAPSKTSKPGIFVCGAFAEPKDIPETVVQASAAAGHVDVLLSESRGSLVTEKEYPEESFVSGAPPRIGAFICHCGINIAGYVDVPGVVEYAKTLPNVEYVERNLYTCSADTQNKMKKIIKEHNLNRVIVASCTPRTHEPLFQETIKEAGLNRYLFEMANIRDQCSWVHMKEWDAATSKAKDLVKMAVAKANRITPLPRAKLDVIHKAFVIGGGITGLNAAVGFAKQDYETTLIEKEEELGGFARNIHETIYGVSVQEYLNNLINEAKSLSKLKIFANAEIEEIGGYVGNFKIKIKENSGNIAEVESGVIVVSTGGIPYVPVEYNYGKDDRVITQVELEKRIFENKLEDNIKSIVMIQCIGSRNEEFPYCSRVCCAEAIKNSILIKQKYPDKEVIVLFRDIRTYGFKEKYYRKAREMGVIFLRFNEKEPPTFDNDGKIKLNSPSVGSNITLNTDLLVLSAGIHPPVKSNEDLAPRLKVPLNDDRFFLEAHVKLRPVDFATEGVFVAGLAHSPKSIRESIMQANAVVSRAATILSKEQIEADGVVANVIPDLCSGCGLCVETCPYNAITLEENKVGELVALVNTALCKGCGACTANCRGSAIDLLGFTNQQIYLMINSRSD